MSEEDTGQEPNPEVTAAPEATAEPKAFDESYVKELRAEAAKHRKEAQEAKAKAQEYEDAQKSELEKAQGKLSKVEQEKAAAESKLLRYEVANDKSVPADVVEFLKGNTREELEASAEKLLSFTSKQAATPDFDGGARETSTDPQQADTEAFITQLLGIQPTQ
ncbi:hypothetical protein K0U83_01510 [bacterium]|nr:hypothetical protein [bacterium]